jgi:hypothetical protein
MMTPLEIVQMILAVNTMTSLQELAESTILTISRLLRLAVLAVVDPLEEIIQDLEERDDQCFTNLEVPFLCLLKHSHTVFQKAQMLEKI